MATNYLDKTGLAKYTKEIKEIIKEAILEDNKKKYYVGKIIIETANVNPATYLGFGTWQYWGGGRVPVGVDTSQSEFNTVEKTGGSKYLQNHRHYMNQAIVWDDTNGLGKTTWIGANGNHCEAMEINTDNDGITASWMGHGNYYTDTIGSGYDGNLQPYITCYMWKRIK